LLLLLLLLLLGNQPQCSDAQPLPSHCTDNAVFVYVVLIRIMVGNLTLACSYPLCFEVSSNRNNVMFC